MALKTASMTVEEFDQWIELPENAHTLYEYIGGEVVVSPSNLLSSIIASRINLYLNGFVVANGLGYVSGEAGLYTVGDERYAPDVGYISKQRLPEVSAHGFGPYPPDLAVEVVSPSDKPQHVRVKVGNYLAAGTVVWVVNPPDKTVEVYVPGQNVQILGEDDTLDGGAVLPGFTLAVADIFKN